MFHRPLFLLSIVMAAVFCQAQISYGFGNAGNSANAYGFTASITGTVQDASNHPVSGARVEVIDITNGRSLGGTFTLENGTFQITNVPHGTYEVVATEGVTESRSRIEVDSDRDVMFRLPINQPAPGNQSSISVSQMNVPGKARRLFAKAEEAFRKSKLDDAFNFVQKALVCYPNYAKALVLRGVLNMQKGDNKDAQPDLEKAVQLDYGNGMGFVALASLYNNEGQFDRARQTLDHGISLNPQSWQANLEMARAELGKGDFGAAIRSLDRAQAFAPPAISMVHLYRAQAMIGLKDYQAAITELQTFLDQSPNDANSASARDTLAKLKEFTASAQK